MDAILQGLSGIFEVVLMAGLGFFLAKKGWFWEGAAKDLTKLTMTVALPPLMGFAAGVILLLANVPIPHFAMAAMKYVGGMATPMALMVIGIQMSQIPLSSIHFDKDLVGAMAGRFLLAPLCLFLLLPFIPVSEMSSKVFLMQAGMPAMTNMTILATAVGADAEYSTTVNCVSLALGVFFVPFYMYMLA